MTPQPSTSRSGLDVAVRVGAVMVAVGAVATLVTLLPVFVDLGPLPLPVYLLCFMAPAGLAVLLGALWQRARTRRDRLHRSPTTHPE